jgi:hypothetical protein
MRLIGHRGPPSSSRCKKLIAELRVHLEQTNETIFWLNQLLKSQSINLYKVIQLTQTQQIVLDILLAHERYLYQGKSVRRALCFEERSQTGTACDP